MTSRQSWHIQARPHCKKQRTLAFLKDWKAMVAVAQFALTKLALIAALLALLHHCRAQQGYVCIKSCNLAYARSQFVLIVCMYVCRVCYSSLSQQQAYSGYMRQQYSYYVSCGYSSRCIRYTKTLYVYFFAETFCHATSKTCLYV